MRAPRSATPRQRVFRWSTAWALGLAVVLGTCPARASCAGDCGNDGAVTIDDLVRGVAIALGSNPTTVCPAADPNGDGQVTIPELIQAVNFALGGCPASSPPSSTATAPPTQTATTTVTVTPTRTPLATLTPSVSRTPTDTSTGTPAQTSTSTPTPTPTDTSTETPTTTPTNTRIFTDVTGAVGLDYEHDYVDALLPEVAQNMGGVAAGDYDGDGWVDLFAVTGDHPNLLLRNTHGAFAPVSAPLLALQGQRSSGPTFADFDGDGRLDLFVGVVEGGAPHLFRNLGAGQFEDLTTSSGLAALTGQQSIGAAFGDYDHDGDLDLFISHWGTRLPNGGDIAYLWRNNGDRTFTDVSLAAGLPEGNVPGFLDITFTPNFVDIDADGWPDLLVAADFHGTAILRNRRDGTFSIEQGGVLSDENGMGAAIGDYDNDGDLDWFVSSIFDHDGVAEGNWGVTGNRLYRNDGAGHFEDATDAAGVRDGYWGWGSCFADFDNDGWLDLFHVNGWGLLDLGREALPVLGSDEFQHDPARLFMSNRDGTFREDAEAFHVADRGQGRGVVCFDYDRDGDIDIFIANNGGPPKLFRNDFGNEQHWLAVSLRGRAPNSEAIGARVYVTAGGLTQMRELRNGSNFESQDPAIAHFGLGATSVIDELRVVWPDGEMVTPNVQAADRYLVVPQL